MNFSFYPTGLLYQKEDIYNANRLNLSIKDDDILLRQVNPEPLISFMPSHGWSQSNEPEEHLDLIAEKILGYLIPRRILCFSYKDISLAKRICSVHTNCSYDILFDPLSGLHPCWPEDLSDDDIIRFIADIFCDYDLFLFRHYLEHFLDTPGILASLQQSNYSSNNPLLYIEVPDCSSFISSGNPLFLWEQHRIYFTQKSLHQSIHSSGLNIVDSLLCGTSIEPSICLFATIASESFILHKHHPFEDIDLGVSIPSDFSFGPFIHRWSCFLQHSSDPIVLFGVGHNSDRFLQLTNSTSRFSFFTDQAPDKEGLYLAHNNVAVTNLSNIELDCQSTIILGVHDRSKLPVARSLSLQYPLSKIYSIFDSEPTLLNV